MQRRQLLRSGLLATFAAAARVVVGRAAPAAGRVFFQRGLSFTAEGPDGYGNVEAAARYFDEFRAKGVNSIALVPYGFSPRGSTRIRFNMGMERSEDVAKLVALAHQKGLKVMWKPQLWVPRGFPGDLQFELPAERAEWFAEYGRFLHHHAEYAQRSGADVLCIGLEFVHLSRYTAEWRKLIAGTRATFKGLLTYGAAQGEEFEGVAFWDALDFIGLSGYYPLPDSLDTTQVVRRVEAVQKRWGKPIVFVEAGYSAVRNAQRAPWDDTATEASPETQARCYEALLKAFYRKPWFAGVYWWKVGTNGRASPHSPWGLPAMDVVERWYKSGR
jgi:hypothetical protein